MALSDPFIARMRPATDSITSRHYNCLPRMPSASSTALRRHKSSAITRLLSCDGILDPDRIGAVRLTSAEHPTDGWLEAIEAYFERGWTDGLPVVPATEEGVRRFLDVARLAPGDIVLTEPVRRRAISAEKLAINAVLAGCEPAYMPVLVAAPQAMA